MAWVSRCMVAESGPDCRSPSCVAWPMHRRNVRSSLAAVFSGSGRASAPRGNSHSAMGSGARCAQIRVSCPAAGSMRSRWSIASRTDAASGSGYPAGCPSASTRSAVVSSARKYSSGGMPVWAMTPAACAKASGRSPKAWASRLASGSLSPGCSVPRNAIDSARSNTSMLNGWATPVQAGLRDVITTCPGPCGIHPLTSAAVGTLSNTISHPPWPRNICRALATAVAESASAATTPACKASSANWSPISAGFSALIHHTKL